MKSSGNYLFPLAVILTPVLIYFYFLKWRTSTIYGDDVSIFMHLSGAHSLSEKINMALSFQKFRPVHGLVMELLITFFNKDLGNYYLFNILIQTANVFLFAAILHLFLRSRWLSLSFSLIAGLSRFTFFNISQLFNGGALEGLAVTFFLLSLFFVMQVLAKTDLSPTEKRNGIISGILFANISMYTHERYIVIFPFLLLVILLFPGLRVLTKKQRAALTLAVLGSILLNVVLKKVVFSIPFFVGTGGSNISFSLANVFSFFVDAVLSIFQINSGPSYLVGISFSSLPLFDQILVVVLAGACVVVSVCYLISIRKAYIRKGKETLSRFHLLALLGALFVLLLGPAIMSMRLEQRWLQASFDVFILMLVIILNDWLPKGNLVKAPLLCLFIIFFIWTDYNYLNKGGANLYMVYSESLASDFKEAAAKGILRPQTRKLYILEKRKDLNIESAIRFDLGNGSLFEFYQGKSKELIFADSMYDRSYSFAFSPFVHFNEQTDQILFLNGNIIDVTAYFRKDSLKYFFQEKFDELMASHRWQYDPKGLLITVNDIKKLTTSGFYTNENGVIWTTGNAGIGLNGDYLAKDSLALVLKAYLPPVCRNIAPRVLLVDDKNKEYEAVSMEKEGDTFHYTFYFGQFSTIQKIRIISDTINGAPDRRVLSFPFISLEIKN